MDFNSVGTIIGALVLISAIFLQVPTYYKATLMGLSLLAIFTSKLGVFYFAFGNKHLMDKKPDSLEKAVKLYRKAMRWGIPTKYLVSCGSLMIQNDALEDGKKALEMAIAKNDRDKRYAFIARVSLSMYYWKKNELSKAIKVCEEVIKDGYEDTNVYVNLCTYELEKGALGSFHEHVKKYSKDDRLAKAPALKDYIAVDAILRGEWKKASSILSEMLEARNYNFADPYLHMAQVKMHYGNSSEAIEILKRSLSDCTFTEDAIVKEQLVKDCISQLEDESTRITFMSSAEKDALSLINGSLPETTAEIVEFEAEPTKDEIIEAVKKEEEEQNKIDPALEEDMNTNITDEDEEWLKKHSD